MRIIAERTEKQPLALLLPHFLSTGAFLQTLWVRVPPPPSAALAPVSSLAQTQLSLLVKIG